MFYEAVNGHVVGITEAGGGLATVIGAAGAVRVSRERFAKKIKSLDPRESPGLPVIRGEAV
jgi:hypothetical protein